MNTTKKSISFLAIFFATFLSRDSFATQCDPRTLDCFIEAKAAYFHPTGHRFRKLYSDAAIYELEGNCQVWEQFYGWTSVGYLYKDGHTSKNRHHTHLSILPISLGIKYIYPSSCVQPYLGAGGSATYLRVKTHSPFLIHNKTNWGFGGIFKTGILINVTPCFMLDVFANYHLMKVPMHRSHDCRYVVADRADISGFSFGAGLGYRF